MIKPQEISKIANNEGVRPQQIEKDYIISWVLWGIYNHGILKDVLIFKGGTCIKKIFIQDYRYSEDIDFTIEPSLEKLHSDDEIYTAFNEIFESIKEAVNIDLSIPEDSKEVHESGSLKFFIDYIGPLGGKSDRIKTDIGKGEKLEFEVEKKAMLNDYSDLKEEEEVTIICYSLDEIVIEKMAALMGRTIPRDLYDLEYLTNTEGIELQDVFIEFQLKAEHKGQDPKEFVQKVTAKEKVFEKAWTENLSHQIKGLRKFKDVWRDFNKQLRTFEKCK
ncbi:MAG: nucleotidyl transferase AbiEii/AbiGii toxin family protein [Desulfobacteraceae bacterium]|nr:MAG: nucleotidyl transferase AbiEii/AbiGii toxin family protein [Desulfobacteraceae bacterium]